MATVRCLVQDVDAATAFYCDRFGFSVKQKWGPVTMVEREGLTLWLSAMASSAGKNAVDGKTPTPGGFNRIVMLVKDLDATVRDLEAAGVKTVAERINGPAGSWTVVLDPSGNQIELFQAI